MQLGPPPPSSGGHERTLSLATHYITALLRWTRAHSLSRYALDYCPQVDTSALSLSLRIRLLFRGGKVREQVSHPWSVIHGYASYIYCMCAFVRWTQVQSCTHRSVCVCVCLCMCVCMCIVHIL